jgi:DNA-binding MarR family transcriptional regulator
MYIHVYMENHDGENYKSSFPCVCAVVRKAGRILTRKYNAHLKPSGLQVTQYSMLANIDYKKCITVSDLARLLEMDQTTVTRNLKVLEKSGLILVEKEAGDQRVKRVRISDSGAAKLNKARPLWNRAQKEIQDHLGEEGITSLLGYLRKLNK